MTKIRNIFKSKPKSDENLSKSKPTFADFRIKSKPTCRKTSIKSKARGKEKDFQYTSNHPLHPIIWRNDSCLLNIIRCKE